MSSEVKPLLILDLDEALIHGSLAELAAPADLMVGPYHVYFREHLFQFLTTASELYRMAVWSSGTADYVKEITARLFAELPEPAFVFSRERCTRKVDFEHQEEYFAKDLRKVKRLGYDLSRTLILEDEPRKVATHFGNAIYLHPFYGAADDELLLLSTYLKQIAGAADFRRVEKRSWRIQTSLAALDLARECD